MAEGLAVYAATQYGSSSTYYTVVPLHAAGLVMAMVIVTVKPQAREAYTLLELERLLFQAGTVHPLLRPITDRRRDVSGWRRPT